MSINPLATVLGVVALYVNYGLSLLESRDTPPLVSSLPPSLGVVATLLWLLQPEFSVPEVSKNTMVSVRTCQCLFCGVCVCVCVAAGWFPVGHC